MKEPITYENFLSTSDFVKLHYEQFIQLFNVVVGRAIEIESKDLGKIPEPNSAEYGMIFFRTRTTENMTVKTMKMSNTLISAYYKRLSELFKEFEIAESKIEGSHFDFLTSLSKGLWEYTCIHFGISANAPNIRVIFVTESKFQQLLSFEKLPEPARKRKASTMHKGFLDPDGHEDCYFIVLQVSRLRMAREDFMRYFSQSKSTSETILHLLIHEIIRIYEEVTQKIYLKQSLELVTNDEIDIYNKFHKDHPEYFTKQSNENMQKTIGKIPAN